MPQRKGKKKGNVVVHQEVEPWDFIPASVQREMEEEERQRSNQNSEGREQESAVSPTSEGNSDVIPSTSKSFGYKDLSDQIKKSKKAKKQGKRHQQQCEEDERIKQIKASAPSKRDIETSAISSFLQSRGVNGETKKIAPDGNCLFASVLDQIQRRSAVTPLQPTSVLELRKLTAEYLRNHFDQLSPFMSSKTESACAISRAEFEEYSRKLESTNEWGGNLELQILSQLLQVPITIFSSRGIEVEFGEEFKSASPLLLSYHRDFYVLGAHYNSVIPVPMLDLMSPVEDSRV